MLFSMKNQKCRTSNFAIHAEIEILNLQTGLEAYNEIYTHIQKSRKQQNFICLI